MPSLTIAIPFFDEEDRLATAIRSVFAQTFADWELLLVDDGSRDRSLEVARSVRDPRVRVLTDGRRRGLPARLNQVVREARAPLIARMDADDVMHPTRLARQLAVLSEDSAVDAVGTWIAYGLEDGSAVVTEVPVPRAGRDVLMRSTVAHATMIARRELLTELPYDEALNRAEDRDLFCRAFGRARFAVVSEPLYVIMPAASAHDMLRGYAETARQNRRIYFRHGPRLVGVAGTVRAVGGAFVREAVYRLAGRMGVTDLLVQRRGRRPTDAEARMIAEAVAAAANTRVPGLD